jgi:hypothetical protein
LIELVPRTSVTEESLLDSRSVGGSILDLLLTKVAHDAPAEVERVLFALDELEYAGFGARVDL